MPVFRAAAAATILMLSLSCFAVAGDVPETEDQKTLYALGMIMSSNLGAFNLTAEEIGFVTAGMRDSLTGAATHGVTLETYGPKVQEMAQRRIQAAAGAEKEMAAAFVEAEAGKEGALKTESGLVYTALEEGTGASPVPTDTVTVHYHGTLRDGTVFDSSKDRGEPATFPLNQVIACWTEGLQRMKVGGKARLVCPSAIAYGDQGRPPKIQGGAALAFDVELIEIVQQ